MSTSISNGYDADCDIPGYNPSKDDGSVTYKAELSASVSASASESFNINNKYSFNLSLLSVSLSAAVKDSTWLGASFGVACGFPSPISFIIPPKTKSTTKKFSTKHCLTYEYTDTINHRGESLSLRAHKVAIDNDIADNEYGTQDITFAGGNRIDLTASLAKSGEAQKSLNVLKGLMGSMTLGQVALLVGGALASSGDFGSTGFRGNATGSLDQSLAISGGALALAMIPFLAMIQSDSKAPKDENPNLKGPEGSGTPNNTGIAMDSSVPAGGKFTVKGLNIIFKATDAQGYIKSSLEFGKTEGDIEMNGTSSCSFETENENENENGETSVLLDTNSITAKTKGQAQMSITDTVIELKQGENCSVKISEAEIRAGALSITSGGVTLPNGMITSEGTFNLG